MSKTATLTITNGEGRSKVETIVAFSMLEPSASYARYTRADGTTTTTYGCNLVIAPPGAVNELPEAREAS